MMYFDAFLSYSQKTTFKNRKMSLKLHIYAGEVYSIFDNRPMTLCKTDAESFWSLPSWFDVNRFTLNEDMCKNDFYIFIPIDLDF